MTKNDKLIQSSVAGS